MWGFRQANDPQGVGHFLPEKSNAPCILGVGVPDDKCITCIPIPCTLLIASQLHFANGTQPPYFLKRFIHVCKCSILSQGRGGDN